MSNNLIIIVLSSIVLSSLIFLVFYTLSKKGKGRDDFQVGNDNWKCIEGQCVLDINNTYKHIKGYDSKEKCISDPSTQCGIKNVVTQTMQQQPATYNPPPQQVSNNSPQPINIDNSTIYVEDAPIIIRGPPPEGNVLPPELKHLEGQQVRMLEEGYPTQQINTKKQQYPTQRIPNQNQGNRIQSRPAGQRPTSKKQMIPSRANK